jgi:hypothetical protein
MNQKENSVTPTYLSVPKLAKLITIISSRNLSQIGTDQFIGHDFSKSDATLAVSSLRFLGLIDENGKATESIKKFQLNGEQRLKTTQEIIKMAYSKLFDAFVGSMPYATSETELENEFIIQYNMSKRTAGSAVRAFLWLCESVGLCEAKIKVQDRKKRDSNGGEENLKQNKKILTNHESLDDKKIVKESSNAHSIEPHPFTDSGKGWRLQVTSTTPLSSEIKRLLVDISEKLNMINIAE